MPYSLPSHVGLHFLLNYRSYALSRLERTEKGQTQIGDQESFYLFSQHCSLITHSFIYPVNNYRMQTMHQGLTRYQGFRHKQDGLGLLRTEAGVEPFGTSFLKQNKTKQKLSSTFIISNVTVWRNLEIRKQKEVSRNPLRSHSSIFRSIVYFPPR